MILNNKKGGMMVEKESVDENANKILELLSGKRSNEKELGEPTREVIKKITPKKEDALKRQKIAFEDLHPNDKAFIKDYDEKKVNDVQLGNFLIALKKKYPLTSEEMAGYFEKKKNFVDHHIYLVTRLPKAVLDMVANRQLGFNSAYGLIKLNNPKTQLEQAERMVNRKTKISEGTKKKIVKKKRKKYERKDEDESKNIIENLALGIERLSADYMKVKKDILLAVDVVASASSLPDALRMGLREAIHPEKLRKAREFF